MMSFERQLVGRLAALSSSLALTALAAGCQQQGAQQSSEPQQVPQVAAQDQALLGGAEDAAAACGLACPKAGIAEGNASISGVVSVDSFFQSVLNFQAKADNVSAGIQAQLAAIRTDFGIEAGTKLDAGLKASFEANVDGDFEVVAEPAKCEVDAKATLEATARCDASVDPGKVDVKCNGTCELDADVKAECDASAELQCTATAPSIKCEGSCSGTCEAKIEGSAECSGTCKGSCDGECSAYVKNADGMAECSGTCNGKCTGSCKAAVEASGKCEGSCEGECTAKPGGAMCEGSARASCKAMGNVMATCKGRCDGEIEPPMAKAECQATAKAEAKVNVECKPPRVEFHYNLKASASAEAQAKFTAAVKNLEVRLPALLASIKKANVVAEAGVSLAGDGSAAVTTAVNATLKGDVDIKGTIGLGCALTELPKVGGAIKTSSEKLAGSIKASAELTSALGV